jgi:hypothetical protein
MSRSGGSEDDYEGSYTGAMPPLPDVGRVDLGKLAPLYGLPPVASDEPEYLKFDVKGRGYFERLFYNTGAAYMIGACLCGFARVCKQQQEEEAAAEEAMEEGAKE